MHTELMNLYYKAEENYLSNVDIKVFRHHIESLQQRLNTYEFLRDHEIDIFQPVADTLQKKYPTENPQTLEQVLRQAIALLRYAAMAMLLNNPEFLQHRLLEWLTEVVNAHQTQTLWSSCHELLSARLKEMLTEAEQDLILPLLDHAQATLVGLPAVVSVHA
ncbi:phycobilisome protein [Thermosynechococcus sp. QKsg1]|uniref:phycobilisome protein n=1 Tax=unclassified Thermosynechococcus TaxID=2622553 RepID=UPI00122DD3C2|nr:MULTISPECIES: phycobilisome protein [unclassified Thermosynechococcus]QEQ00785.1 phycobilisome protein [Thermosynechococcus sp. CL-1]WJI25034.1 phycobilisome protein [Thermosynechococcus sp. B0]WKT84676.1 phycobilisome protein [Thermosynechococcus sp. HY596]WNC63811.1 phycobilisome protein [Thermosynechococcus sp. HY591]WNC66375.1 phycobilisome protein [Thermosynechococcus sp. HY593]